MKENQERMMNYFKFEWASTANIVQKGYTCGFCGNKVGPSHGYVASNEKYVSKNTSSMKMKMYIYICPTCFQPSFFDKHEKQYPGVSFGSSVQGITDDEVNAAYEEARNCYSVNAFTAAVLLCRKILMNIAASKGAKEGETFTYYVEYLEKNNYMPPNGKEWADKIRKKGNDATHKICVMEENDARLILVFTEMLLKFNYEMTHLLKE